MAREINSSFLSTKIHHITCLILVLLISGCGSKPTKEAESTRPVHVFYPALPNAPRIQYLTSFSSSMDVGEVSTAFAEFVLGKDKDRDAIPINKPYGVSIKDGKLYVVDTRGSGYDILDLEKKTFQYIDGGAAGGMPKPINITLDEDGSKYVTDTLRNQVLVFDNDNQFVRALGVKGQFKPSDTSIEGDRLFVSDIKDHEIEVLNKHTGITLYKIGKAGQLDGELFHPTNIKIGPDKNLYISETTNFRIQKFTLDGKYIRSYGDIGTTLGKFARPKGIALDHEGRLFVVDAAFENVQVLDPDGKLLMFFGSPGGRPEHLNLPTDIEIDYENIRYFQKFAHPDFKLEYIILVSNQFGRSKVNVYGFGKLKDMEYPDDTTQTN